MKLVTVKFERWAFGLTLMRSSLVINFACWRWLIIV